MGIVYCLLWTLYKNLLSKAKDTCETMFDQQLRTFRSVKYQSYPKVSNNLGANALEFQYELCQIFLKKTGQQLHEQESQIMQDSTELLRQIKRCNSEKGTNISTDSGGESAASSLQEEETFPTNEYSRRAEGNIWRKLDSRIGIWMAEMQENCSALCVANIKAIINDYRKLLQKVWEIQAREGLIQRKNQHYQRQHQENLILKQKNSTQEVKLNEQNLEIECLKQKNESLLNYTNEKLKEMLGNQKIIEINEKVFKDVKNYLQDKQRHLSQRSQRVQSLEEELLGKLFASMPGNTCEGCCQMLKKLKDSLFKFKRYLESEGGELQKLINKYKKTLFTQRSCSKL